MLPRQPVTESLGVDISRHLRSYLVRKRHVIGLEHIVHPCHTDAVRALQMTHGRVLARAHNTNHSLVVVIEDEVGFLTP